MGSIYQSQIDQQDYDQGLDYGDNVSVNQIEGDYSNQEENKKQGSST